MTFGLLAFFSDTATPEYLLPILCLNVTNGETEMGTVYLVCFEEKFHHAKHYIGFTQGSIEDRFDKHKRGHGAKLLKALNEKGIDYEIVRVWEDVDYDFE